MLENTLGDLPKDVPIDLPPKNTEYGIDFLNSFKCIDQKTYNVKICEVFLVYNPDLHYVMSDAAAFAHAQL